MAKLHTWVVYQIKDAWPMQINGTACRVIAYDNRGHGHSQKLYDTESYGAPLMAEDARRLMDHLSIERADIMGYSLGSRITTCCSPAARSASASRRSCAASTPTWRRGATSTPTTWTPTSR